MNTKLIFHLLLLLILSRPNVLQPIQTNQLNPHNQVESGFVFSGEQTFYGLNIDTTPSEIRFSFTNSGSSHSLVIQTEIENQIYFLAGMNTRGGFIAGQYSNLATLNSNMIEKHNLFINEFLSEQNNQDLQTWLDKQDDLSLLNGEKFLIHTNSVTGIIEMINNEYVINLGQENYAILLPTPIEDGINFENSSTSQKSNSEIFDFLRFEIIENINSPSIETHLSMAHNVKINPQNSASILINPKKNSIYITLNNDINKIWLIDLNGGTIETYSGFEQLHKGNIPQLGVTSKDLSILNFSNESLMTGIVYEAAFILIIIGLTIFFELRRLFNQNN